MQSGRRELSCGFARRIYGPRALGCALSLVFVSTAAATQGGAPSCNQLDGIRARFTEWADNAAPVAQATLSIGLIPYLPKYASEQDWIRTSDQTLYKAKRSGKSQLWLQKLPIA